MTIFNIGILYLMGNEALGELKKYERKVKEYKEISMI